LTFTSVAPTGVDATTSCGLRGRIAGFISPRCFRLLLTVPIPPRPIPAGFRTPPGYWLASTELPDVIITDLLMPRGNGDYVVECLKQNAQTRNIPLIVLSGVGVRQLEETTRDLAVEEIFTKPVEFDSLYRAICALV
jgi:CheY-like chemotaxis protein